MNVVLLFKDDHKWQINKEFGGGCHGLKISTWHLQARINTTTKQCKYSRQVPPAYKSKSFAVSLCLNHL
jgi:hypothetical protein